MKYSCKGVEDTVYIVYQTTDGPRGWIFPVLKTSSFLFNHCSAEHAACFHFPGLTGEGELFAHLFTYSISGLLCRFFSPVPGFFGCFFGSVPGFLCIFLYLISCTHLSTIPETVLRLLLFFLNTMFSLVRCFFCPVRYFSAC